MRELLSIGFDNNVVAERVVAILEPSSAPMKRLREEARAHNMVIDASHGRKTRAIIVMDSNHVVLSGVQAETLAQRFDAGDKKDAEVTAES